MKETLNLEDFKAILAGINIAIQENKVVLSKLDSIIGDGDHGVTIAKGLEAAMEKLETNNPLSKRLWWAVPPLQLNLLKKLGQMVLRRMPCVQ